MKIIKIICLITAALSMEVFAAKETRWVPSGDGWKNGETESRMPVSLFETDIVFVQVHPGYDLGFTDLKPLAFGILIKNKTNRDGNFYYSKTYLKDNDGFTIEVITKDQAHENARRAIGDIGRIFAETFEKSTFRSVERLQPASQKSGSLYFERSWIEDRKKTAAFQLYIGPIAVDGKRIEVPALTVTRTRFDIDQKGNVKIIR